MIFAAIIAVILALVLFALVYPFWRAEPMRGLVGEEAEEDQDRLDLEIEKRRLIDSLAEMEVERDQGKWSPEDYERLKSRDEHRLVGVLDRLDQLIKDRRKAASQAPAGSSSKLSTSTLSWAGPIILGVVVVGGAAGIYSYLNAQQEKQIAQIAAMMAPAQAQSAQGLPNPAEMVARLEARLKENPDDLQGQIMAGRSYTALGRLEDAKKAWRKVLEMDPRDHEAHFHLGVLLLEVRETEDPTVFAEALDHFNTALIKVPREPAILWYKGLALLHLKRRSEVDESWTTAYQNLMPGSKDAEYVRKALEDLRADRAIRF